MTPAVTRFQIPALDPVALLRALGLEDEAPVVLLDSAGGSPQLARRHYLAWDPVFRLRARHGVVSVTAGAGVRREGGPQARALADQAGALTSLEPFEALRRATRLAALPDLRGGARGRAAQPTPPNRTSGFPRRRLSSAC